MFNDFTKASAAFAETIAPHPTLDSELARESKKLIPIIDFPGKVQVLLGNTEEKRALIVKRDVGPGLDLKDWKKLRELEAAPMDKELFRKVCRTALAAKLIPADETSLAGILPKKAKKIDDNWPVPSPNICAKILNVFSKIEPPQEVKPDPYAKLYEEPKRSKKGKPSSPYSFSSIYPS